MILLRLLTAGKSLIGVKNTASPYQVTNQRLLPKFGAKKNPFRTTAWPELDPTPTSFSCTDPKAGPSSSQGLESVAAAGLEPGSTVAASEGGLEPKKSCASDGKRTWRGWSFLGSWLFRKKAEGAVPVKSLPGRSSGWVSSRVSSPTRRHGGRASKAPVQQELSLDKVQVVRNDLSGSDMEVVVVKPPEAKPAPPPAEQAFREHPRSASSWGRVAGQLFGTEKI
jgi:hypothetical protein